MQTHNLGYPRIGAKRELKKACEKYWSGQITQEELVRTGWNIRIENWRIQQEAGLDLIPSNDFSFYDQVLDMSLAVGAIPERYHQVILNKSNTDLDLYFAMARGYQKEGLDLTAMEMTKWFDSNYHYIVPEFTKNQQFRLFSPKITNEFLVAQKDDITTKPVILGPVSYLLLGKEKESGFDRLDLISQLLPVYLEILTELDAAGAEWIQFDEPFLSMDLSPKAREVYSWVYAKIRKEFPLLKILIATYFGGLRENLPLALSLPVCALHLDLVRCPEQLDEALDHLPAGLTLSLGLVDGRNIWKNDFQKSLKIIQHANYKIGDNRIMIAPSCSLLHVPHDLEEEKNEQQLIPEIKSWLAFAKQKIDEVAILKQISENPDTNQQALLENQRVIRSRKTSSLVENQQVEANALKNAKASGRIPYASRKTLQQASLNLPLLPTTTIGSFPQTREVRNWRSKLKKGEIGEREYQELVKQAIDSAIKKQEEIGLDLLVHGEFERNDMVEYFGEQLNGFAFTQNGWVQSYGSRCVKPPIIYGDVDRPAPMTVFWSGYAQSLTRKWVKGMLTGPVTILQWSFVRDDQPREETCRQIAEAIREEVMDLEKAGIKAIQIDEPAIREGLPLKKADWKTYLDWAVQAFRIASSGVRDDTQIHTHMCYSEFNDIMESIAAMDADVITIECSRSQMELLDAFADFNYPNEIGPGVYDIHSPRVPSKKEMIYLIEKAQKVIPTSGLWVNPDCGLKTRNWPETEAALRLMVEAAGEMRLKAGKETSAG
ncbi:5-methyltetrahydropteroyltriglutamate--homocysteine S-methyltransferase [Cyclobacterium sp.]|uniref:5-methyltetrahydropteroyltriglutamate-- homocysteine S-methyltransferase n=1 Tax=Cyclobacterium sp. TaxID=1966343 RepID=UPI0019936B41|nr:5-methyltetrahydropteroyltriglutamate--homocysteine S-methyltransferase [Cyclobacterium sp.]MBD3630551.1 5-methyltetrahydropteroyltriglutamate--homocysteine S-methyltransferase [Cyclobacterium sp.]